MVHKFPYKANVHVENSYGFGVLTSGIDLSRFSKNPIVLKNHSTDNPVGTADELKFDGDEASVIVLIDDESDEGFQKIIRDINKKLYQGLSMGLDIDFNSIQYGVEGFAPETPVFTKSELQELSICPLPSNEDCLRLTCKGKSLTMNEVKIQLSANSNPKINSTMNKLLLALIATMKLAADTTEDQAISKLKTLFEDQEELAKLRLEKTEWTKKEGEIKLSRINDLVDGAITAKKILPAQKEDFVALAQGNFDAAKRTIDALPVHKTLSTQVADEKSDAKTDKHKDWDFTKFQKEDPKALLRIKNEDPERYKQLFNDKFAKV